jgi:peptidoglycan/LPS O-acetylase OafA/YrhL
VHETTTTRPTAVTGKHLPALNGLRAVAVLGVMAYHLQLGWARGGYLGVDLFFVLSGFLITTLLLEEWLGAGRINLAAFWGRRARRLLPALFLVVLALALYLVINAAVGGPGANGLIDLSDLRGDAIATLLYVGNWHAIYAGQSYFAQFSTPSPLQHTWSLAIEEQFYVVWPLLILFLIKVGRRSWRQFGLAATTVIGLASFALMATLFTPGADPTRIYYGTDTRLFDLMAGATIAFLAAGRRQPNARAQRTLHLAAPAALVALGVFWVLGGNAGGLPTNFMFEGGFLICAVLAAVVVADARLTDQGPLARGLSLPPLHFLGTISYGIYLWHWSSAST